MDGFKKRRAEKVAQARARFVYGDLRELLIHFALKVGLPVDTVKRIRNESLSWAYERLTLIGNRRLVYADRLILPFARHLRGWAGTQRMVNRRGLLGRYITNLVPWFNEITDLGLITYDGPNGFMLQGEGMMNVHARYRSPF